MHRNEFKETMAAPARNNDLTRGKRAAISPSARRDAKGRRLRADLTAAWCRACYEVPGQAKLCTEVWTACIKVRRHAALSAMILDDTLIKIREHAALRAMLRGVFIAEGTLKVVPPSYLG